MRKINKWDLDLEFQLRVQIFVTHRQILKGEVVADRQKEVADRQKEDPDLRKAPGDKEEPKGQQEIEILKDLPINDPDIQGAEEATQPKEGADLERQKEEGMLKDPRAIEDQKGDDRQKEEDMLKEGDTLKEEGIQKVEEELR